MNRRLPNQVGRVGRANAAYRQASGNGSALSSGVYCLRFRVFAAASLAFFVRMISRRYRKLAILAAACAFAIGLPFLFGFFGDSATRIRREHGLQLPASASHFVCGGDAWISIMDRGASSAFEMAQTDLSQFISQL